MTNTELLEHLAREEGYDDVLEFLEANSTDSVVPAICKNPDCLNTEEMEPDQDRGWCSACHKNTVVSCLVLAEII